MHSWPTLIGILLLVFVGCQRPAAPTKPSVDESSKDTVGESAGSTPQIDLAKPDANPDEADTMPTGNGAEDIQKVATDVVPGKPAPDKLQVVSFDELNLGMPEDSKFRPMMLTMNDGRAKQLNGCLISIGGHMNPPDQLKGLNEFVLLKNKDCKFGPGGQADHLMRVFMKDGKTTDYTDKVIYVEGIMTINPFPEDEPSTWSIYDIEATSVSTRPPSRQR